MLLITMLLGVPASAAVQVLSIDEAVRLALQNNVNLQAQRHTIAEAEGELLSARIFPHNPQLEVEGAAGSERNGEREDAHSFGVELSQELELGGQQRLRIRIATAGLKQTQWEVRDAQRELIKEVKEAFYRILFLEERQTFVKQTVDLAQQLSRIAEARFSAGESPQLDVNLALVELQNTLRQRGEVRRRLTQARFALNRLLGHPVGAPLDLSGSLGIPPQPIDTTQLLLQALQQRPDLQSRSAAVEIATGEVGLAKAERIPDIEVGFIFEQEVEGENVKNVFGGKISFPLPLWNRNQGEIRAAQARFRAAELEHMALQQAIETEVVSAVAEVNQLRLAVQLFEQTILPQSRENLTLLRQAFAAGEIGIVALITQQREFIATNNEYLDTRFEYQEALAVLQSSTGVYLKGQQ
jgi:cobalt-zinc-cadmium efflux system outer membrane protein